MIIEGVEVRACRLPPAIPWEDATNAVAALEFLVVDLKTRSGLVGTGFTYSVDVGGSSIRALAEDYLAPLVVGMDARHYERIWNRLARQSRRLGIGVNSMAVAAFDIAVWDLIGKHRGEPLYRLLGGARDRIPAYASEINLADSDTAEALAARVDGYMAEGFGAVKIKIGRDDPDEDDIRLEAVRRVIGKARTLFVDLNQKWDSAEAASRTGRLRRFDLGWIEEPLACHDVAGHAALRRLAGIPIALGESLHARHQFLDFLRADAVDFIQADVAFVGGITEWMKIANLAAAFGKRVAPHYMTELSLHLLCGVQNAGMLEVVCGGGLTELGLLEEPIEVRGGVGIPPERPGHGIVFSREALEAHDLAARLQATPFKGGSK